MNVEFYKDQAGEYRWRVISSNGKNVAASSEGFASEFNARRNLEILADFLKLWRVE
jgi:uncharacterized protein YegP (UPF0339 family)